MTVKTFTPLIWDFPMKIFNSARGKIAKMIADRAEADARWLNG